MFSLKMFACQPDPAFQVNPDLPTPEMDEKTVKKEKVKEEKLQKYTKNQSEQ